LYTDIMRPIYLDYNATTPVDPAVREAMLPYLGDEFGNPSSTHAYGTAAHAAVEKARSQVAGLIGAEPDEIVFTGGGSEASNLAIKGVCQVPPPALTLRGFFRWLTTSGVSPADCHVVTTTVEHPATREPLAFLRRLEARVTEVRVDRGGMVDPSDIRRALTNSTRLVTVMHSNNETGTLMPIREIAAICRQRGILVHTDCAQSLGKVPVSVRDLGVDLVTIAGHKLYAPKGVGALYVRRGVRLEPHIHGAPQESDRRAGTENVPYIVGLGKAAELAAKSLPEATDRLRSLRDRLHERLRVELGQRLTLNGHPEQRLPNTLNVNFVGHKGPELLAKVPGVAASNGAACHETRHGMAFTPSAVLCAMRVPPEVSVGAVRLSVGRYTTEDEVDRAADLLVAAARVTSG
jgi:cysteine desulfurase